MVNRGVQGTSQLDHTHGGNGGAWIMGLDYLVPSDARDLIIWNANSNTFSPPENATLSQWTSRYLAFLRHAKRLGVEVLVIPPFTHFGSGDYTLSTDAAYVLMKQAGVQPVPVESVIESPTTPRTAIAGTLWAGDTQHVNTHGADVISSAFVGCLPTLDEAKQAIASQPRAPLGTYADPSFDVAGGLFVWTTDAGVRRKARTMPVAEADGRPYGDVAPILSTVLLRNSLAAFDFVEGADTQILYDKSGNGLNGALGATAAKPTWIGGGGATFDAGDYVRLTLDALKRLRLTPGLSTFSIRFVLKPDAVDQSTTIFGRRGNTGSAASNPFGLYFNAGKMAQYQRDVANDGLVKPSTTGFEEWLYTSREGEPKAPMYRNGALVQTYDTRVTDPKAAAPWDIIIGGRFNGTDPATATPLGQFNGVLHWMEISQSFVSPASNEASDKHAAMVTALASRSLAWAA